MRTMIRYWVAGLGTALFLAGCGGGGGGDGGGSQSGTQPVAAISAASNGSPVAAGGSVKAGVPVALDGSGSKDAQSWQWTLDKRPEGSTAALADANAAKTDFTPDLPGEYQVSLAVVNGSRTANAVLSVVAANEQPIARLANSDVHTLLGPIQLDGSTSLPPAGGLASALSYQWTLKEVPPGSTLRKIPDTEASLSRPRFTADETGVYLVELRVLYGDKVSEPATAKITVVKPHSKPVASMTAPATALRDSAVTLDGSGSSLGSGGTTMQYRWSITSVNPGPTAVPPDTRDMNKAVASFTPKAAGTYTVSLTVFDGVSSATTSSSVVVTKPASAANTAPVVVLRPSASATVGTEAEKGTSIYVAQAGIYDIDEASMQDPYYEYRFTQYPAGFDAAAAQPPDGPYKLDFRFTSIVTDNEVDNYTLQVRVRDKEGAWSEPGSITFQVRNGANRVPIASAATLSGSLSVLVGAAVGLTGEASSDLDKNRLSYAWALVDRPDGSAAALSGANSETPSFTADKAGLYTAELTVTDSHGAVSKAPSRVTVQAKSQNNKPVARPYLVGAVADKDQPLVISEFAADAAPEALYARIRTHLWNGFHFAADAYDPDGDTLTYQWRLVQEPANTVTAYKAEIFQNGYQDVPVDNDALGYTVHPFGAAGNGNFYIFPCVVGGVWQVFGASETVTEYTRRNLQARSWSCSQASVAPREVGDHRVELTLYDGMEFDGPYAFDLRTVKRANYPTLLLEDTQQGGAQYRRYSNEYNGSTVSTGILAGRVAQRFFPFSLRAKAYNTTASYPNTGIWSIAPTALAEGDNVYQTYQLTAFDRDYTIEDLKVATSNPLFQVRFDGLRDKQVIKKGDTVAFKLVFTAPAQSGLPTGAAFYEAGEGIEWSFRIGEREGWTFSVKPRFELTQ